MKTDRAPVKLRKICTFVLDTPGENMFWEILLAQVGGEMYWPKVLPIVNSNFRKLFKAHANHLRFNVNLVQAHANMFASNCLSSGSPDSLM